MSDLNFTSTAEINYLLLEILRYEVMLVLY